MLAEAADGLALIFTWTGMAIILGGVLIGGIFSALPGLGGINAMALLLPVTFAMEPVHAITFLVAITGATGFLGAVSSILINVPGDGINAATILDGYPMARQGRAGEAIAAAGTSSALGALFGIVVLVASLPLMRSLLLSVGPPEVFAFALVGVALVASVSSGSTSRGLIAGLIGLVLGTVGLDIVVGEPRHIFGQVRLYDGIPLIPVIIGLFAFPELYQLLISDQSVSRSGTVVVGGVKEGILAVLRRPRVLLRSSLIGTAIGIVPGVGGAVATWIAYFAAQKRSKDPDSFGTGNIEGVIAPEAANDAKEGGTMMPLLALGVPGSISSAILLTAFLFHGVTPGRRLFENDMPFIFSIIFTLVVANVVIAVVGISLARQMIKLTTIPISMLAPIIVVLALLGAYVDQQAAFGILIALLSGALGLAMVRLGFARPPLLIGLILLPIVESNYHTSVRISRGSHDFLLRPVTALVLVATVLALVVPPLLRLWRARHPDTSKEDARKRAQKALEAELGADSDGEHPESPLPRDESEPHSSVPRPDDVSRPRLATIAFLLGLLTVVAILWVDSANYDPASRLFPRIILVPLGVLTGWKLARDVVIVWRRRHADRAQQSSARDEQVRPQWMVASAILAFPVLIGLIGMVPAVFVYTGAFILTFDARPVDVRRLGVATAVSLGMAVFVSYVFGDVLGVRLPSGLFI